MKIYLFSFIAVYGFLISCKQVADNYTVVVDNVEGLQEGSDVTCEGFPIGKVMHLNLFKDSVVIDIEVSTDFKIPVGSKFIVKKNILNSSQLIIERSKELSFVKTHDTISGYKDTSNFIFTGSDTIKQKKIKESIQKIADGFKGLIEASSNDSTKK